MIYGFFHIIRFLCRISQLIFLCWCFNPTTSSHLCISHKTYFKVNIRFKSRI
ncbi:unnamed protein product [Schistosoma mattheei]|uniref:Uncharacterized protein n=1 Tax=Schistosoma mattheei TaxID=31246 RepID=A0A3P8D9Q2_9TREM|nr:unnamed protein product [Schistosoma mattheei]